MLSSIIYNFFFFFNDTATTEIYTLSLHDALPILTPAWSPDGEKIAFTSFRRGSPDIEILNAIFRSEEHTSELQSLTNLVCRLLLEKKKKKKTKYNKYTKVNEEYSNNVQSHNKDIH